MALFAGHPAVALREIPPKKSRASGGHRQVRPCSLSLVDAGWSMLKGKTINLWIIVTHQLLTLLNYLTATHQLHASYLAVTVLTPSAWCVLPTFVDDGSTDRGSKTRRLMLKPTIL